jgi:D-alanyl-lipoteichoic acid acyltransferase DltB (MBOAT superfamily)
VVFSSVPFLFYFLPLFLLAYFVAPTMQARNGVALVFSLVFYAWGEPHYSLLLLVSIGFNWLAALMVDAAWGGWRRAAVGVAIAVDLGLLGIFKYAGFVVANLDDLGLRLAPPGLALPLGISFYTFHCLSYLVDVYRGKFRANRRPIEIALYIALFPQLIAGPIVRYSSVARQLRARRSRTAAGARIFIIGLAVHPNIAEAWTGLLAYTLQIYFDFAGYSNMAIGLGLCLGFAFPRNFRMPYTAASITEFWRRWHMSLSSWLRDYLYIPLGGNRGRAWQTWRNLITVFLLCGLWHGASWNFVVWGAWHGGLLIIERLLPRVQGWPYATLAVMAGWVPFRTADLRQAWAFGGALAGADGFGGIGYTVDLALSNAALASLMAGSVLAVWRPPRLPGSVVVALLVLEMVSVAGGAYSPFLYFRF